MEKNHLEINFKKDALKELSNFLYDAYIHNKQKEDDKIRLKEGPKSENEEKII